MFRLDLRNSLVSFVKSKSSKGIVPEQFRDVHISKDSHRRSSTSETVYVVVDLAHVAYSWLRYIYNQRKLCQ